MRDFEKQIQRHLKNALNRTLTKVTKEQKQLIIDKTNIKPKYLKGTRYIRQNRAKNDDLQIRLLSIPKAITPHMLEIAAQPTGDYFEFKKSGLNFYARTMKKGVGNTQGFKHGSKKAGSTARSGKTITRGFYYLTKLSNLDDEARTAPKYLQDLAIKIFADEVAK